MRPIKIPQPSEFLSSSAWKALDQKTTWTRYAAQQVVDFSAEGMPSELKRDVVKERHATFDAQLADCVVIGRHQVHPIITNEGTFHCQEIERYQQLLRFHVENQEGSPKRDLGLTSSNGNYYFDEQRLSSNDIEYLPGSTFFGSPLEPDNWGMWLLNGLTSAHYYRRAHRGSRYLCWARSLWQRQLLKFMGVPEELLVIQQPWRAYHSDRLNFVQYSRRDLTVSDLDREIFQGIVHRCVLASPGPTPEKIYVSRKAISKKVGYRQLQNEDELEAALIDLGFHVVQPETLSFPQQVSLFHSAKFIVGAGGAGMFNVVFAKPATTVVSLESSNHFVEAHANLFASLGLHYSIIFGRQDLEDKTYVHKRWSLDVPATVAAIQSL